MGSYKFILIFLMCCFLASCATVKPYQQMYVNDDDMKLTDKVIEQFDVNFESYREGASGGHFGKTGGGCGCN